MFCCFSFWWFYKGSVTWRWNCFHLKRDTGRATQCAHLSVWLTGEHHVVSSWTPAVTWLYGSEVERSITWKYFCSYWTWYMSTSVNVLLLSHTSQMTADIDITGTNSSTCDHRLRPPTKRCTLFSVFKEIYIICWFSFSLLFYLH